MSVVGVARRSQPSLQQYLDLVCLVMAYSFTDSEERDMSRQTMMVPFVDLLNHHSNHHAELSFHPSHLELVAVRNISQVLTILQHRRENICVQNTHIPIVVNTIIRCG